MEKSLDTKIRYLKGVGPRKARLFNKLGITTIEDLLYYFPRRYEDRSNFLPISKLQEGQEQTIKASVLTSSQRQSWKRRRFNIFEAVQGRYTVFGLISLIWRTILSQVELLYCMVAYKDTKASFR